MKEYNEKKRSRSSQYQNLYAETAYSNDMMECFRNEDSLSGRLNPFEYNEDLLELEDQLKVEFWRIVDTLLTKRQREVIRYYADGYTQMEIASILNINQSSVVKNWSGSSLIFSDTGCKKMKKTFYGGSKKKLKKLVQNDERIQILLKKMDAIRALKW